MAVLEGWELSPDRKEKFDKMMADDDIGEPILISKCKLGKEHGLLIVSDNGFAWRIKVGFNTPLYKSGTSKWVRWHDVSRIIPDKPSKGRIKIECFKRKNGALKMKKGKPKTFRWRATVERNKGEDKAYFKERRKDFYRLMNEIYERNKVEQPPAASDSRI